MIGLFSGTDPRFQFVLLGLGLEDTSGASISIPCGEDTRFINLPRLPDIDSYISPILPAPFWMFWMRDYAPYLSVFPSKTAYTWRAIVIEAVAAFTDKTVEYVFSGRHDHGYRCGDLTLAKLHRALLIGRTALESCSSLPDVIIHGVDQFLRGSFDEYRFSNSRCVSIKKGTQDDIAAASMHGRGHLHRGIGSGEMYALKPRVRVKCDIVVRRDIINAIETMGCPFMIKHRIVPNQTVYENGQFDVNDALVGLSTIVLKQLTATRKGWIGLSIFFSPFDKKFIIITYGDNVEDNREQKSEGDVIEMARDVLKRSEEFLLGV